MGMPLWVCHYGYATMGMPMCLTIKEVRNGNPVTDNNAYNMFVVSEMLELRLVCKKT